MSGTGFLIRLLSLARPCRNSIQQCRCYRPKLPRKVQDRLNRYTKPFIPGETTDPGAFIQDFQTEPDEIRKYRRKAWAKFGSASGVDVASLIPTKEEVEEELEAEQRWWPTLQKMQQEIAEEREMKEKERFEYEKRVAENMAKMPQWIKEWEENQQKIQQKADEQNQSKLQLVEEAIEKFDYKYGAHDTRIKEYVREQQEQRRLLKKKAQKLRKQMKSNE